MELSKLFTRVVVAGLTAGLVGCANMGSVGQKKYALADSQEMQGTVKFGNAACRDAGIKPVELTSHNANQYRSPYSFRMAAQPDNDITERAPDGRTFILVSDQLEAMSAKVYQGMRALAPATGAAIGARGAIANARRDRHTDFGSNVKNAATGAAAVAIGNAAGQVASIGVDKGIVEPVERFFNGGATKEELTDICRAAVRNGDYGGKGQGGYRQDSPASYDPYNNSRGYNPYDAARNRLNLR